MSLDRKAVHISVNLLQHFCFEHLLLQPMGWVCVCVKCVHGYIMRLLQADGGLVQNNPTDGENESHHQLLSLRTETRRERNKPETHFYISLSSPPLPPLKSKISYSQSSALAAHLFGFTWGTAGNIWDVSQQ